MNHMPNCKNKTLKLSEALGGYLYDFRIGKKCINRS